MYNGDKLAAGKYIVMVKPQWNEAAELGAGFKQVRIGLYAPVKLELNKLHLEASDSARLMGYRALECILTDVAEKCDKEKLRSL